MVKTFNFNDVVPVGKYKGQTFKEMSKNHSYFDWFLTWVCTIPIYNSDFMYHQDMKDLKWERRKEKAKKTYGNTKEYYCKEFKSTWADDVYGGFDSSMMQ